MNMICHHTLSIRGPLIGKKETFHAYPTHRGANTFLGAMLLAANDPGTNACQITNRPTIIVKPDQNDLCRGVLVDPRARHSPLLRPYTYRA
jgi:hypothetical protein